ncbi:class I SAM-dependent methyltransferase [Staphylococcus canis]|uniref:Methyltransferase domain-containing protein n=1 Tax=Staphylococcus canis TaxID=2724942 RepID=A0ABS0T6S0_9STAP|nr:class I SAM-dependent methyltransferase [Staphylococcus canis]MBI5974438.1 methyltransferase domain-containing protein [Staphylococcus canis]
MEFLNVFKKWADVYDETVFNAHDDNEYKDVFKGYNEMLDKVATLSSGRILEIGAGTGNLTERLLAQHEAVKAIDPSEEMRNIANQKLPQPIQEGHFLDVPLSHQVDTIVSTFAFHHLKDEQKQEALVYLKQFLAPHGKVIMIDTVFDSLDSKEQYIKRYLERGYLNLVEDLNTEYYTTVTQMEKIVESLNGHVEWERQNDFAQLMIMTFD